MEGSGDEPRRPVGRGGRGDAMRRAMEQYKRRPGANLEDNGVEKPAVSCPGGGGRGAGVVRQLMCCVRSAELELRF